MTTSQPRQPKGQPVGGQFAGKQQSGDEVKSLLPTHSEAWASLDLPLYDEIIDPNFEYTENRAKIAKILIESSGDDFSYYDLNDFLDQYEVSRSLNRYLESQGKRPLLVNYAGDSDGQQAGIDIGVLSEGIVPSLAVTEYYEPYDLTTDPNVEGTAAAIAAAEQMMQVYERTLGYAELLDEAARGGAFLGRPQS